MKQLTIALAVATISCGAGFLLGKRAGKPTPIPPEKARVACFLNESPSPFFVLDGKSYSLDSLPLDARGPFVLAQIDAFRRLTEIAETVAVRASRSGSENGAVPPEEILTIPALMGDKWVSDAEVEKFVKENPNYFNRQTAPEAVRKSARLHLETQRSQSFYQEGLEELRRQKRLRVLTPIPCGPKTEIDTGSASFVRGNPNAPVRIVHFTDFQCPQCRYSMFEVDRFLEENKESVRLDEVFVPPEQESFSAVLLRAGHCIQAKYGDTVWERFRKAAFQTSTAFSSTTSSENSPQKWESVALGLADAAHQPYIKDCLQSEASLKFVEGSLAAAKSAGVSVAPAFFVAGRQVVMNGLTDPAHVLADLVAGLKPAQPER